MCSDKYKNTWTKLENQDIETAQQLSTGGSYLLASLTASL